MQAVVVPSSPESVVAS